MDPSQKDIEIALRMLQSHREVLRKSYYKHQEKRIEYARQKQAEKVAEKVANGTYRPRGRPPKVQEAI